MALGIERRIACRNYGERLEGLPLGEPARVADTPVNKPVIERMCAQKWPGITSFSVDVKACPEKWLVSILGASRIASRRIFRVTSVFRAFCH